MDSLDAKIVKVHTSAILERANYLAMATTDESKKRWITAIKNSTDVIDSIMNKEDFV